jgi:hypothetical protein
MGRLIGEKRHRTADGGREAKLGRVRTAQANKSTECRRRRTVPAAHSASGVAGGITGMCSFHR